MTEVTANSLTAKTLGEAAAALTPPVLGPMMPILTGATALLVASPLAIGVGTLLVGLGAYDLYKKRGEIKKVFQALKNNEPLPQKPLTRWDHAFNFALCGISLFCGAALLTMLAPLGTVGAIAVGTLGVGLGALGTLGLIGNTMYVTTKEKTQDVSTTPATPETGAGLNTAPLQADFTAAMKPAEPETKAAPTQDNQPRPPKAA